MEVDVPRDIGFTERDRRDSECVVKNRQVRFIQRRADAALIVEAVQSITSRATSDLLELRYRQRSLPSTVVFGDCFKNDALDFPADR